MGDGFPFLGGTVYENQPIFKTDLENDIIQNSSNNYMTLMKPYLGGGGSGSASTLAAQRRSLLDPYIVKPRTKEEILAEQRAFTSLYRRCS